MRPFLAGLTIWAIFAITTPIVSLGHTDADDSIDRRTALQIVMNHTPFWDTFSSSDRLLTISERTCGPRPVWLITTGEIYQPDGMPFVSFINRSSFAVDRQTGALYSYSNADSALIPIDDSSPWVGC